MMQEQERALHSNFLSGELVKDPVLLNDWHIVAQSKDVVERSVLSTRLLGEDLVLWRCGGEAKAWQDLCLHRGAKLSLGRVEGGRLVCAYHGWTYNCEGACVNIPAHPGQEPPNRARVRQYSVSEKYGYVWVSRGSPKQEIPSFPEWDDRSFRKIYCGPYHVRASGPRVVENFLDVAHLPFVHEGLLGDREHAQINDYEVRTDESGITASGIRVWQPDPDGTGRGAPVVYTYKVFRPLTAYFVKESLKQGFSIFMSVTPVNQTESLMWMIIAMNYATEVPESQIREFEDQVVSQDIRIVESQRPELLPLDLQAELHLRSDRTAIAYRKWLGQLGLSFGTA
ncbi:MAG: aromatic ring-hydroxylating dioxygenase subunit alpha [Thaumarchaeota archaeon]|nr:aromatic ring-hydroxylating dioxygenase subunit alpha [Nitrososphaerota archaeon]